jgi:glyoxylate reductase
MDTRPKVLLTRKLVTPAIDLLKKHVSLEIFPHEYTMPRAELLNSIADKNGLICLLTDTVDSEVIQAGKVLKIIANYAVGYNNIDVEKATQRNIFVTNTPGVLTETTADLTFTLILSIARRIVEADRFVRNGNFTGWDPQLLLGKDVYGKTIGIIGFGRIGRAVSRRAHGFNMRVLYYEPERLSRDVESAYNAEYRTLDAVLREADYITLHVPLTPSTQHMIGERELSLMKSSTYLVNVSRGPVVDERALVEALKTRAIAGCALDVYEREPAIETELMNMTQTVLLPHIGSASEETRTEMALMTAENVIAVLVHNSVPSHVVNAPGT